jgi:hypothetical protein
MGKLTEQKFFKGRSPNDQWLSSRTQTPTNVGKDVREKEHLYTVSGNVS